MQPTKTQAIKGFLNKYAKPDLAELYSYNMEVQCNVAKGDGTRVDKNYKGKTSVTWTDGLETWKPFRIPFNAGGEASYEDSPMSFNLEKHVEGIGMTGWDWVNKTSRWVAFDFDSLVGHSDRHTRNCTDEELSKIRELVMSVPWVTVRRSAGGNGLHLYVFVEPTTTVNHNEHAALARSIIGMLSGTVGFDFSAKVDVVGGNMWVWHRKSLESGGLSLIKAGTELCRIPFNWKDHIPVVKRDRFKTLPSKIENRKEEELFELLCSQRQIVDLDAQHKNLLEYLQKNGAYCWWDADRNMLVAHTYELGLAHEALKLKGDFRTLATGSERGIDINCFAYPIKDGGWVVRRFTPGVQEESTWSQDKSGWTKCYLNKPLDVDTAAKSTGGIEEPNGYYFDKGKAVVEAVKALGGEIDLPDWALYNEARLKEDNGRILVEIPKSPTGKELPGWAPSGKRLRRYFTIGPQEQSEPELTDSDDTIRHVITDTRVDAGWLMRINNSWVEEPPANVKLALKSKGNKAIEADLIMGSSVMNPWTLVNRPFEEEYPGGRIWNYRTAQLRFKPTLDRDELIYPTWTKMLNHVGRGLDYAISQHAWCKEHGIISGADWLKCWIASLFQSPRLPLPYLFFFGDQNVGKSTLQESLELLITDGGVVRANSALTDSFNGELLNAVVCVIEELDLSNPKNKSLAYNRIKDWTVGRTIQIHQKHKTPIMIPNCTKWIQIANDRRYCPIFPGDTRITMIEVYKINPEDIIPKSEFMSLLTEEAPDFLASILQMEIPKTNDRFNIPVIDTEEKLQAARVNRTPVQEYFEDVLHTCPGEREQVERLFSCFSDWCNENGVESPLSLSEFVKEVSSATDSKVGLSANGGRYVINKSLMYRVSDKPPLTIVNGHIFRDGRPY